MATMESPPFSQPTRALQKSQRRLERPPRAMISPHRRKQGIAKNAKLFRPRNTFWGTIVKTKFGSSIRQAMHPLIIAHTIGNPSKIPPTIITKRRIIGVLTENRLLS